MPPTEPVAPESRPPALSENYKQGYGTPDKLQALADGYFGLNRAHIFNILIPIAVFAAIRFAGEYIPAAIPVPVIAAVAMLGITAALTLPCARSIGYGKGWPETTGILATAGVALSAAAFLGVFGGLALQLSAMVELKKYGVDRGLFSRRKDVDVEIAKMKRERGLYTRSGL